MSPDSVRTLARHDPNRVLFGREVQAIHCVGVGGMGVAPLAIYLAGLGFRVTGQDDALPKDVARQLARAGVDIGEMPADCDLVAYSSAILPQHPAWRAAEARGVPRVRRGELLAEVVRDRKLVAVCGSHGKTTTTSMLITAIRASGFPAGYVLGGLFADDTPPAAAGENEWVVAEIDESDGTIERFSPEITLIVNLDWDHPDHYRRLADLERTFAELCARTRQAVLVSDACALSGRLVAGSAKVATFGRAGEFGAVLEEETSIGLRLKLHGRFSISEALVHARGEFNATNATAALAALQTMGGPLNASLLSGYTGVRRRQTVLADARGLTVIEDYAHHPAEIRALLGSLRGRVGATGRLVVVFQPHRFSRTAQFKAEFAAVLSLADSLHLLDVYPAGEAPIAGGTTADIYAELKRVSGALPVSYLPGDREGFFRALSDDVRRGDLVAFVGAGDIDRRAREWLKLEGLFS